MNERFCCDLQKDSVLTVDIKYFDKILNVSVKDVNEADLRTFKSQLIASVILQIALIEKGWYSVLQTCGLEGWKIERQACARCMMEMYKHGYVTPAPHKQGRFAIYPVIGFP